MHAIDRPQAIIDLATLAITFRRRATNTMNTMELLMMRERDAVILLIHILSCGMDPFNI